MLQEHTQQEGFPDLAVDVLAVDGVVRGPGLPPRLPSTVMSHDVHRQCSDATKLEGRLYADGASGMRCRRAPGMSTRLYLMATSSFDMLLMLNRLGFEFLRCLRRIIYAPRLTRNTAFVSG